MRRDWHAQKHQQPGFAVKGCRPGPCGRRQATGGPLAYVIDDEAAICQIVAATLNGLGVESESFHTADEALAALDRRLPAVIFLDVALLQSDAIDVIHGLGERNYRGTVHLMSGGNPSLVDALARIGARSGLTFGPPLNKPFKRDTLIRLVEGLGLGAPDPG
jgi:two-component system nitrogen regulation response regulator NtrX